MAYPLTFESAGASKPRRSPRILCAEDDELMRRVIKWTLEVGGYLHDFANDGQEALDYWIAHQNAVDVLLTDHQMPRVDGLELVTELRNRGFTGEVIVFSSGIPSRIQASYETLAVSNFLAKGTNPQALLKTIEKISAASGGWGARRAQI